MTSLVAPHQTVVDVVFPLRGRSLPREHAQALQQALCAQLPWLATDAVAAIHPVKVVSGSDEVALLSQRARLLLRVEAHRLDELMALAGLDLVVAGHDLHLDAAHWRELLPLATLYAYKVAAPGMDEAAFMASVDRELADLAIAGERVCGKRQHLVVSGRVLDTFSLMLHALAPQPSLRLQQHGLGPHRLLGCGVFVPHKSAAAVWQ